jgi:bacillithiol biosynthesis deacetylase BshB1
MKLHILAFAAHPDDVELASSGTLLRHKAEGKNIGIVDLTRGELGTRGTPELRTIESAKASELLQLDYRANLGLADGFFSKNEDSLKAIIQQLRHTQPDVVLANAINDRHIDHGRAADLVADACFLSGLRKIETVSEGKRQEPWRPKAVYHYIQDRYIHPNLIVDITPYWELKMASIKAYSSQFYNENSDEPQTPISSADFIDFLEARAREMGRIIGVTYGEGFTTNRAIGVSDLTSLL